MQAPVQADWAHFTRKAEAIGARVERVADPRTALERVRAAAEPDTLAATAAVAAHFPQVGAHGLPTAANHQAREVVTAAHFAVAETGSLAVADATRDRGACFLSERLWVLVANSSLLPSLEAALERIAEIVRAGSQHATLMTGPSRTADIERTLTIGVHGPRELVVLVVGDEG